MRSARFGCREYGTTTARRMIMIDDGPPLWDAMRPTDTNPATRPRNNPDAVRVRTVTRRSLLGVALAIPVALLLATLSRIEALTVPAIKIPAPPVFLTRSPSISAVTGPPGR